MSSDYSQNREEMAKAEMAKTSIQPAVTMGLIIVFLIFIFGVPIGQAIWEFKQYRAGSRDDPIPHALHAFALVPSPIRTLFVAKGNPFDRIVSANRELKREIDIFEDRLEDESGLVKLVLPSTQRVLSGILGAGNEKVFCGRDGWLFYRPEIDYLTGPGFLEPRQLAYREENENIQPDPRPAILQFNEQLKNRGIHLVVLPTPVKPMVHPEKFASSYEGYEGLLHNPSYERFRSDLEQAGITVFDMSASLIEAKGSEEELYLRTDTHWLPETMESAASELAEFLRKSQLLADIPQKACIRKSVEIRNQGDIAAMLKLPRDQTLYPQETVSIKPVSMADEKSWRSSSDADILVLGDSFSNIYSMAALGWGESAGFVEQLSYELQRPLDCILRNDNGAFSTRIILAEDLARGNDRLDGKRIVIYQFAARELAVGDWRILDMEPPSKPSGQFYCPDPQELIPVTGTVQSISVVPAPHSVPYKDHILTMHLIKLESDATGAMAQEAVVHMWSMRDNVWTEAARYRPGHVVSIRLRPWSELSGEFDRFNRSELDDERLWLIEPCWGEPNTQDEGLVEH